MSISDFPSAIVLGECLAALTSVCLMWEWRLTGETGENGEKRGRRFFDWERRQCMEESAKVCASIWVILFSIHSAGCGVAYE